MQPEQSLLFRNQCRGSLGKEKTFSGSACSTFLAAELYRRKTTAALEVLAAEAEGLLHKMNIPNCLFVWAVITFVFKSHSNLK